MNMTDAHGYMFGLSLSGGYPEPYLQHYGLPTNTLDVSYEPIVALWFATHRFYWLDSAQRIATYEWQSDGAGVVYVLESPQRLHDIRYGTEFPFYGLRAIRQQGGLVDAPPDNPDLFEQVTAIMSVAPECWDRTDERLRGYSYRSLVPDRSEDSFYDALLLHKEKAAMDASDLARFVIDYR